MIWASRLSWRHSFKRWCTWEPWLQTLDITTDLCFASRWKWVCTLFHMKSSISVFFEDICCFSISMNSIYYSVQLYTIEYRLFLSTYFRYFKEWFMVFQFLSIDLVRLLNFALNHWSLGQTKELLTDHSPLKTAPIASPSFLCNNTVELEHGGRKENQSTDVRRFGYGLAHSHAFATLHSWTWKHIPVYPWLVWIGNKHDMEVLQHVSEHSCWTCSNLRLLGPSWAPTFSHQRRLRQGVLPLLKAVTGMSSISSSFWGNYGNNIQTSSWSPVKG